MMSTLPGSVGETKTGAVTVVESPMTAPAPAKGERIVRRGTVSTMGRLGQIVTAANRWRENYNPARGLTIRRAVELLELAQRGDTAYLQWTFRTIERRYPTLSALITRCEGPLLTFDWEIKVKERLPDAEVGKSEVRSPKSEVNPKAETGTAVQENPFVEMAKRQQATLQTAYEGLDNLKEAIQHLHLAEFRGYAHLQKHRNADGSVYHLEPLNQWCVCRDGLEGNWFWNPDSKSTAAPLQFLGKQFCLGGAELPIEDFIIREVPRPIDEIALVLFIRSNLAEKDADGFLEIYGIPGGVVIMPPNVPQGKESEYEAAAKAVAEGGSGAIPSGADYKANDGPRGVDPFSPRLKHLDEQVVMVGTGGKLTMLAESGSGTLAGGAHSDTFEEIADGRAQKISERFQRDFDREVLEREHPGEPVLVYFKLGTPDSDSPETTKFKQAVITALAGHEILSRVIANQTDLKELVGGAGMPVNEEYSDPYVPVTETTGAAVTGEVVRDSEGDIVGGVAEALKSETRDPKTEGNPKTEDRNPKGETTDDTDKGVIKNRARSPGEDGRLVRSGHDLVVEALQSEFEGLNGRLAAIAEIDDPETQKRKLAAVLADLDTFEADLAKDPEVAQAIYRILAAALGNGLGNPKAENRNSKVE